MSAQPIWLTEQDEQAELDRMLGEEHSPAEIDALVSDLLYQMRQHNADLARYKEARDAEHTRVDIRYDNLERPAKNRLAILEGCVRAFAEKQDFGKKKSRETANGVYGHKLEPARVKIVDAVKLVEWCQAHAKGLITLTPHVKHSAVADYFDQTGDLPSGVEYTPPGEVSFARPDKGLLSEVS
jgi:hypothetical protein